MVYCGNWHTINCTCLKYNLLSLDMCIYPWKHHYNQHNGHIHSPPPSTKGFFMLLIEFFPPAHFISVLLWLCSWPQGTTGLLYIIIDILYHTMGIICIWLLSLSVRFIFRCIPLYWWVVLHFMATIDNFSHLMDSCVVSSLSPPFLFPLPLGFSTWQVRS